MKKIFGGVLKRWCIKKYAEEIKGGVTAKAK